MITLHFRGVQVCLQLRNSKQHGTYRKLSLVSDDNFLLGALKKLFVTRIC